MILYFFIGSQVYEVERPDLSESDIGTTETTVTIADTITKVVVA